MTIKKKPAPKSPATKPGASVASKRFNEEGSAATQASYQTNPGIQGTNFDPNVTYMDRYTDDDITFSNDILVHMDEDLRNFLFNAARITHIYLDSMLAPNGIRTWVQFQDFAVHNHNFSDLDHVYTMLGPNALGMEHQMTARLLMFGHYIATTTLTDPTTGTKNPILIYDSKTKIFRPEAFDVDAWRRAYLSLRRSFGIRFDKASQTTFETYRRSLRVAPESIRPGRAFSAIQSMHSSVPASVPPVVPSGPAQVNISVLEGSNGSGSQSGSTKRSSKRSSDKKAKKATLKKPSSTKPVDPKPSVKTETIFETLSKSLPDGPSVPSSDPSDDDASSTVSSNGSDSSKGSSSENDDPSSEDSSSTSDSSLSASSSDDSMPSSSGSSDSDSFSGSSSSNSSSFDSSSLGSSSDDSTMPSGWGTKRYKAPRDAKSLKKRVKKYEKKARRRARKKKRSSKGHKKSKKSKRSSKSSRKHSSSRRSKSYLKKRSVLTMKDWNGVDNFFDVITSIRNFVDQQQGMSYIASEKFQDLYRRGTHKEYLVKHRISTRQFVSDQRTLHAYLSAAFEKYTPTRDILWKYRTTHTYKGGADGIKAYRKINKTFGLGGDAHDAQLTELFRRRSKPYKAGHKGGLAAYVNEFQTNCSEIERYRSHRKHAVSSRHSDHENCTQLLTNLSEERRIQPIYASAYNINNSGRHRGNLKALCSHVRSMAITLNEGVPEEYATRIRRSHGRLATLVGDMHDKLYEGEGSHEKDIIAMLVGTGPNNDFVPPRLWRALDRATQSKIMDIRRALAPQHNPSDGTSVATQRTSNATGTPALRPSNDATGTSALRPPSATALRANSAQMETIDEDSTETDGSEDPLTFDEDQRHAMNMLADYLHDRIDDSSNRHIRTSRSVHCDYDKMTRIDDLCLEVYACLGSTYKAGVSTADGGADSYIAGTGHRVHKTIVGQKANVFGFDSNSAKKMGLPIGSADCVVTGYDLEKPNVPFEFIVRINQAVLNLDSRTTLTSEIQLRSHGAVVDTVHKDFDIDATGNKGTQRMILQVPKETLGDTERVVVPFVLKRGLMTYEHRYPEDEDYQLLQVVEMTSDDPWDPRKYTDSKTYARDAAGHPRDIESLANVRVADTAIASAMDHEVHEIEGDTASEPLDDDDRQPILSSTDATVHTAMELRGASDLNLRDDEGENEVEFHDALEVERGYHCFFDDDYFIQRKQVEPETEDQRFFDCKARECDLYGRPVHLNIDFHAMLVHGKEEHKFIRSDVVDETLDELTLEELTGMVTTTGGTSSADNADQNLDTFAFTLQAVKDFQDSELESLRPNFGFRPVDIIRRTLDNTTQYAKAFSPFPMHRHFKAMYKFFNMVRLQETVATDTVLVSVKCVATGSSCAQVFYGVRSKMINVYGMMSKREAHDAYQDFLREEGVPQALHRDNAGEQKDTRFQATNRELHVRDTTTEPYHPHQNPAETRAIRFLKRVGKSLITMSGAPKEVWLYALKYVAMINNWTSHESLDWKTPFEKRHGVQPDISPLLAYRFYQPVYYYVDDGFPDSGEKLGYILGVNENVGSHMTFDILTDDKQTVLPRSVIRPADQPIRNKRVQASVELDPALRVQDRLSARIGPTNLNVATDADHAEATEEIVDFEEPMPDLVHRTVQAFDDDSDEDDVLDPDDLMPELVHRNVENADDDVDIFVDGALPMHNRQRRRRARNKPTNTNATALKHAERKRKDENIRSNKKHARSNKKHRKKKRIGRMQHLETPRDGNTPTHREFTIDEIVTHRKNQHTGDYDVLVSWEGFDASENSWEPASLIRETAAATLARYAFEHSLHLEPSWEWTHAFANDGTFRMATDPTTASESVSASVEGDSTSKRSNRIRKSRRNAKKATRTVKSNQPSLNAYTFLNNILATFGIASNNNVNPHVLKNYTDFDDSALHKPLPIPSVPLETATYDDPTKNLSTYLDKVLEIQQLDKFIEKEDEWTIVKVLCHATRRVKRRIPRGRSEDDVLKNKHIRLHVMFMDGDTKWIPMDAALLQDPIPVIEYVQRNKFMNKPKFKTVRKMMENEEEMEDHRRIFKAKVSKAPRYHFGVEIPRNPTHAALLDKANGNKLWGDATVKELKSINDHNVFRFQSDQDDMREYKRIPYQLIFDCKHDGRRKARLVAGGHMTAPPSEDVYAGVVGMDTVRLAFAVGAMQGLDVCAADISTAFLYGKTKEKVYIIAGPEFGPELEGKKLLVGGNWYGLKSAAARFAQVASAVLRKMGFRPTKVDANLWIRKKGDHYEYLAIYVDDVLAWGKKPLDIINEVKMSFKLQGIGFPDYYLGADVNTVDEPHLKKEGFVLGISPKTYIKNSLDKLSRLFDGGPFHKAKSPMVETYHPEQDSSPLLSPENISKYRALIGSANWIVTLGRFDIAYATSTMARYSMAPREGHLAALKRVFGYLRTFPSGELLVNPRPFNHEKVKKQEVTWQEFYPDAVEELPPDQPESLPTKAQVTIYVDADHAHDTVTRRSVTGIMVFVNQTLVRYISKRQKTVETSSYGSELVAARMATEIAMEYRYSLRMMGVEIDGPCRMFGDNNSVILNTTLPSSMLKKKHQSIAYHATRMAQASGVLSFEHVRSEDNWADVLTKPLPPGKFHTFVRPLLFRRSGAAAA